jgi:hypothetical protein
MREDELREACGFEIDGALEDRRLVDEALRTREPPHAQAGCEHLREAPDLDDPIEVSAVAP